MSSRPFRPLTGVTEPPVETSGRFDFIVTGDGRPTLPFMPYPRHGVAIMGEIALLRPACVLYTGDAFWGYGASPEDAQ